MNSNDLKHVPVASEFSDKCMAYDTTVNPLAPADRYMMHYFNASGINRSALLSRAGLKEPDLVCRGTQDYLLFMREIGCVIRIVHETYNDISMMNDFYRRLHPTMITPLGWIHEQETSLYIYPGFQLEENNPLNMINKEFRREFQFSTNKYGMHNVQAKTDGFSTWDGGVRNMGYYRTDHDERAVFIDTDCTRLFKSEAEQVEKIFISHAKNTKHAGRAYERTAMQLCSDSDWSKSVLLHRELRDLFFDAFPGAHTNEGDVDPVKMANFWHACHEWTHNPKRRIVTDVYKGLETGNDIRVSTGAYLAKLYRPWCGEKPIKMQLPLANDPRNKLADISGGFKQNLPNNLVLKNY